ncbi:ACP phosphodiesterase [Povalibacter sp.]|uniref:acyl carrier protein phosphodiesterase n=1 Tax=Povalibacter sp. TaxID=1962978 RepID=UPI002F3FD91E
MNWLAHTLLSEPTVDFQLGNLLADLVRGEDRILMSADFQRGAACHKAIDAFTDSHPVVRRGRARVGAEYRRFSGVLIDVFYDYLLANQWQHYSSQPLQEFVQGFYAGARVTTLPLPPDARMTLDRIVRFDLLASYRELAGVEHALRRISTYLEKRWRRPFSLQDSVPLLSAEEAGFAADFAEFFPQLQAHVAEWMEKEAAGN